MSKAASAEDLLKLLFEDFVPFRAYAGGEAPIPYHWVRGNSNLVVITGDNASGKSFARRIITQLCRETEIEPMAISMQGRTTGGMMSAFVYGAEDYESTGQISARTVTMGIKTCRSRQNAHMVFWDEPDLGLSDSWAAGVGVAIAEFSRALPELTKGVFVVSHSKSLVSQLLDVPHHFVHFGEGKPPADLATWCKSKVKPRSIEQLADESHKRFKLIQAALNANKAKV